MPNSQESANFLMEAYERARNNDWKVAAELARKAVEPSSFPSPFEEAEALEFSAKCHFKAAFQSDSRHVFVELMSIARGSYKEASTLYKQVSKIALSTRAESRSLFANFWINDDFAKRRDIIYDCISLSSQAAKGLELAGDNRQLAMTRMDILNYFRESMNLSSEWRVLNDQYQQAHETARKCLTDLEGLGDLEHLVQAESFMVWLLSLEAQVLLTPTEFRKLEPEVRELDKAMTEISQRVHSPNTSCLALEAAGNVAFDFDGKYGEALELYEKASHAAKTIGDNLLRGRISWLTAQVAFWHGLSADSDEKMRVSLLKGIESAQASISLLGPSRPTSDLAAAHASFSNCHIEYANHMETSSGRKEEHLRTAIQIATVGSAYEDGTWGWVQAAHALCSATYYMSKTAPLNSKRQLLLSALPIRNKTVQVADRLFPSFWNPVVMRNYSALLKFDLALDEESREKKIGLLEEAASEMRTCLRLGSAWATSPGFIRRLAIYSESFGIVLYELFLITRDLDTAKEAISAFDTSIAYLDKCGHFGAIGPVRWRKARIHDALSDFELAADAFRSAAQEFRFAATKMPGLASTYEELAIYMDAWNRTEKARIDHDKSDFSLAAVDYSEAGDLLQSSKSWNYLSGLFKARSVLEKGESLSKEENHAEAARYFGQAGEAFKEARHQIEARLQHSSRPIEQQEMSEWLRVTQSRDDYCHFRAELEEARELEKVEDRRASARKYEIASDGFKSLKATISPFDPEELDALICFCDAWGKMQEAEAQSSSELYTEAADIFLSLKEGRTQKQFRLLGLANSSICRALAAGMEFRQTRQIQSYAEVKKWLESAADYYREAGFGKTESWTRATQRLFDALVYLFQAETDKDPRKKTSLYHLAESQLESAAKLYDVAGFPSKKLEALGRLERVREERKVLVAALEGLSKIPVLTGSSLVPISLSRGQPSGLERFEEAYIVGELSMPQEEVLTGTTVTLELDIANVGRTAANLLKVDHVIQEGLLFDEAKNSYKRENDSIMLGGKRLDHLQTLKARVTLEAATTGNYQLRPKIFFTDDRGNYRSYEFRPNTLKVLETRPLSQSGMATLAPLSTEVQVPEEFRFDTQRAKEVFQRLINDFLKDYVSKRLSMDNAGWRTLMQVIREAKTPRSSFYGPQGKVGPILAELQRRGLVEVRVFPGERGRGGAVRKLRVAYDNRIVRDIIQKAVMTNS